MDWIKVLNRHVLLEYSDLRDSEFAAWIKIMSLTAQLEHEPSREQILKYVNYQTLNSLSLKLQKHSIDLPSILHKVLIDASYISHRREVWKNNKQQYRADNKNVSKDVSKDVSNKEKEKEKEIDKEKDIKEPPQPPKENETEEPFVLPDYIPALTWKSYMAVRVKKRAAQTPYAFRLIIKELERLRDTFGNDPVAVLNKSITGGWSDVYQLKNEKGGNGKKHAGIKAWLENDDEETGQNAICEGDGSVSGDIRPGTGAV